MGQLERKLGERVADRRKGLGMTQAELADRVGVATQTISRLERGSSLPGLSRIEAIARALQTELHELLRLSDRPTSKEVAIEEVVSLLAPRTEAEIRLVLRLATEVLAHADQAGRTLPDKL